MNTSITRPDSWVALAAWLIGHTRSLFRLLTLSVIARIVGQLLSVTLFVVAATAIARAATGSPPSLPGLIALLVGVAVAKATVRYLEHFTGHWVAFTALQRLRDLFFARLVPQAPAATRGRAGAELTGRAIGDIDRVEAFYAHTFPPVVAAVVVPTTVLVWLGTTVDAGAALVLVPFVAGVLAVPWVARAATQRAAAVAAARRGALGSRFADDVQGALEVIAFDAAERRIAELDHAGAALALSRDAIGTRSGLRAALATGLQLGGAIAVVAWTVGSGAGPETIAVSIAVCVALWATARGVDGFVAGTEAAFAATARIRAVVDAPVTIVDPERPRALPHARASVSVSLDAVTLRYRDAHAPALREATLDVPGGEWAYIVGVSGSGKSSVAGLLLRGWDPASGAVRLGGTDVRDYALDDLRRMVALVPQRPTTLAGSVADNLRLAAPEAPTELLWSALDAVDLASWARSLPDGLDTALRERGGDVSGGQLQRLAIARALVARPAVLVLDEALSQLDHATAVAVREGVARLVGSATIIEITHRVDLIPDDAHTVLLDAGRVLAAGTARQLRADSTDYARLAARGA